MTETLRSVDGWTVTLHPGYALLVRGPETITLRWVPARGRSGRYRCTCGQRGCAHPGVLRAAQITPVTGDWSGALEPWD